MSGTLKKSSEKEKNNMAILEKGKNGVKTITLESDESAIVFTKTGIHQILSEKFRATLYEAQSTKGASIIKRFDNCKPEEATSVINDFVLIQVVGLLTDIMEDLKLKK
jgi:hypothetical protein